MLFESLGVKVHVLSFIDSFECGDFEMLAEWMKWYRKRGCRLDSEVLDRMFEYSKKFNMDVREMFKYMMNDEDNNVTDFIIEYLSHNFYDCDNDTDERMIWDYYQKDRKIVLSVRDVDEKICGNIIDFVTFCCISSGDYVYFAAPGMLLDEAKCKAIKKMCGL